MKRQEAVLRRLLLGDDGSADKVKQRRYSKKQDDEDGDDQAMLYLAREVSKQTLEVEAEKRAKMSAKEKQALAESQAAPAPSAPLKSTNSFDKQIEEAIVQSLLESTRVQGQGHSQGPLSGGRPEPRRGPSSRGTPPVSRDSPVLPAAKDQADPLNDPAVQAFMEKRKQRQQQQKEEALQRSLAEEAQRLVVDMATVPPAPHSHPSIPPPVVLDPVFEIPPISSGSTPQHRPSKKVERPTPLPAHALAPAVGPAPVTPYAAAVSPVEGGTKPEGQYDPMHIFHPNNASAYKAVNAILKLARKQYKDMPESEFITKEGAAIQLASIWLNQAASHVFKHAKEKEKEREESYAPLASPAFAPAAAALPAMGSPNMSLGHGSPGQHAFSTKRSFSQNNMLINANAIVETPTNIPVTREVRRTLSVGGKRPSQFDWECSVCTLVNKAGFLSCEVCGTLAPSLSAT